MAEIKTKYEQAVNDYILEFCEKQGVDFDYWVQDIAFFGDIMFNFDDIRHDIDTNQPKDNIINWYDATLEHCTSLKEIEKKFINYNSWCMGLRYDVIKTAKRRNSKKKYLMRNRKKIYKIEISESRNGVISIQVANENFSDIELIGALELVKSEILKKHFNVEKKETDI